MLHYIKKVLQNGELKKALEEKQEIEEKKERERLAKEKEEHERKRCEEAERLQKYFEEKRPKYLETIKRAESIVIPKRKKEALSVNYEDFDALMYAIRQYTLEEYPQDEAHALRSFFHGHEWVKFWMPDKIIHCMDRNNYEYTMRKSYTCIAIRPKK